MTRYKNGKKKVSYEDKKAEYLRNIESYKKYRLKNRKKSLQQNKDYHRTKAGKFSCMKRTARKRKMKVEITRIEFDNLIGDFSCYYCDHSFKNEAGYNLNRIDSNKGYTKNNLKPCCKICNKIMNVFTKKQLKDRVYKIIKRMK